jgi:hypothetical protein
MPPPSSACLLGLGNPAAMEETRLRDPCCPTPGVWQQGSAGPLGAHLGTCAQQVWDQGEASGTAQSRVRLLAALSRWRERPALTATDLNDQRLDALLQDRSRR